MKLDIVDAFEAYHQNYLKCLEYLNDSDIPP